MVKHKESIWKGVARKLVGCAAVAGLAATMSAGAAFATDQTSTTYALPTADQVISFQHEATDDAGNAYTYEYVTIGSNATARVAPMMQTYYEVLGLNYINAYRGPDSIFNDPGNSNANHTSADGINATYTTGSVGALQTRNSTLAIMGSSNNVAPDEYIWNYCCWANGAEVSADRMALDHGNGGTGAVSVTISGTEYADFPRDVYMECNILSGTETAEYGGTKYLEWIELENNRDNRPKTGTYDPYYASYGVAAGGGATMVKGLHTLATTIDEVVAQSADANGNFTLQSRYGGNSATGTGAAIDKYEDLVQATQYYVLSKIAKGDTEKAVTALLVGYDPTTGNYACRKYNVKENDKDANVYGGRVGGYLASISTSITELGLTEAQEVSVEAEKDYVAWYTPEQIVNNCDAAFICDAPSSNNISTYLATSSDNACHVVYSPATIGYEEEDNTTGLTQARTAALANGSDVANFCFSYPANMFGNFYAQGVENGMLALITSSFTYPEIFGSNGLTDMLAYWAKYVWHIKDSSLQTIVEGTCSYMSMQGLSIGTISSDFEANAEKLFLEGNKYYLANMDAVDAMVNGNLKTYDAEALAARVAAAEQAQQPEPTTPDPEPEPTPAVTEAKAQTITASNVTKTFGAKAFNLNAKTDGDGKLTYKSSNAKVATVDASGKVTIKGAGTAKITVTASATSAYKAASKEVTVTVKKAANTLKLAKATRSLKAEQLEKAKKVVAGAKVSKAAKGAVTYKIAKVSKAKAKFSINNKNGKITVQKGTAKGTYRVTVSATAKGNANYKAATKKAVVTIKVK